MNQASATAAGSGTPFPRTPQIIFTNWREALHHNGLSSGIQTVYGMAVEGYLDYCAHNAISVTTESARAYMDEVTRRAVARQPELWKEGLNWFFRAGRQHTSVARGPVPALHQADTGAATWEQRLIGGASGAPWTRGKLKAKGTARVPFSLTLLRRLCWQSCLK